MLQVFINETLSGVAKLEKAFETRDLKQVKFLAHRMKSSLNNLNISSAAGIAEKIENAQWTEEEFPVLEDQINDFKKIIDEVIPLITADYSELQYQPITR
jgi:HPt (histidine-containing phosphotransfer) domain-containing protein